MPEFTTLPNGVRIISETVPSVRSVSLGIWVKSGSRKDPKEKLGIAHFLEHMLFKGTEKRSSLQISKEIDALGGLLNASTSKEYTVYYVKILDEFFDKASDVLFDIFLNSTFDEIELEKEKGVVLQEIKMSEDTPDDHINDLFAESFYHNTPLGTPILGTEQTIGSMCRNDLIDFTSKAYTPDSIFISGAGNITHERLKDITLKRFSSIKTPQSTYKLDPTPPLGGTIKVHEKNLEQVHFILGTHGPSMTDGKRWAFIVLNTILGSGMSSMLFQEVREKLGLTYAIYSYLGAYGDCGVLGIYAGTTPENLKKTLEVVGKQTKRMKSGDLGEMRFDEIKSQIKGHILLSQESTENHMSTNAKNLMYFGRLISPEEVTEKINAVKVEEVVELANSIFVEDKMTYVSLGKNVLGDFKISDIL